MENIIDKNFYGSIRVYKYVKECPYNYSVWPIGRQNFRHPCCIPLCKPDNSGNPYHIDAEKLLYMKLPSERIAREILHEASLRGVDSIMLEYLIKHSFDDNGFRNKSISMVEGQLGRLTRYYKNNHLLPLAEKIANHYKEQIKRTIKVNGDYADNEERYSYAVRSHEPDTPFQTIKELKEMKVEGLYIVNSNGMKMTPSNLYFGCDTRLWSPSDGKKCGDAYFHFCSALYPVYLPDGKRFHISGLSNVCCRYKNGILYDWYRE